MTDHPYSGLPTRAFWKTAVANRSLFEIDEMWTPKFQVKPKHKVVTFGSCFAQHIGRALQARGYGWYQSETAPDGLPEADQKRFNYGTFSARTGNIYTTSLLRQWTEWAVGDATPPDEVWEKDGRFYDPFRPRIEPNGFVSVDEMKASQAYTIDRFAECIKTSDFFVFTMGLTESWVNGPGGYEYPMCPGTVAGDFDAEAHQFVNQDYETILKNMRAVIRRMREVNKGLRFILTVSPVPLTATMDPRHVVVSTMASKSILRAVADRLVNTSKFVDYFPSYEIINSPAFKGAFFQPNQRDVVPHGVDFVMNQFFACQAAEFGGKQAAPASAATKTVANKEPTKRVLDRDEQGDLVCEEGLLKAFAPQ